MNPPLVMSAMRAFGGSKLFKILLNENSACIAAFQRVVCVKEWAERKDRTAA